MVYMQKVLPLLAQLGRVHAEDDVMQSRGNMSGFTMKGIVHGSESEGRPMAAE
ncbi:hypothetical protein G7A66_11120 [Altererythrobacter sp. SALINAS58]|uniref:hypothetical protein n=1 Tax=Alteripontixanthobacter muriae TaxID=2705546 RepID=UPI001576DEB0|nr:hypothetical protein [Alteripontixanthobacter muriae]NTZ43623.1 hypothetical protein [Alteripontixanthobacter muriae]